MRVFIAGIDGYLGWSLTLYLGARGHEIVGIDSGKRRDLIRNIGACTAIPILSMQDRVEEFEKVKKEQNWPGSASVRFIEGDLTQYEQVETVFEKFKPETIVHLGEVPSAPYSMKGVRQAVQTLGNNITGTIHILYAMRDVCPNAHLVKLGTMGEYGTPDVDIPEGFIDITINGRTETVMPFPKQAGSWYHQSKVHDTNNIMMACRLWGLRSTDIMQGIVYGTKIDEMYGKPQLATRLDFDECFGTAINRFCCQAVVGEPVTLYGIGRQKRGFLPLRDSMQCLTLALDNPPERGEYRVFNQFEEVYIINELAEKVKKVGDKLNLSVIIRNVENPRKEKEDHYYKPEHKKLLDLGYTPTHDMEAELEVMLKDLIKHKQRILNKKDTLLPKIHWSGEHKKVEYL